MKKALFLLVSTLSLLSFGQDGFLSPIFNTGAGANNNIYDIKYLPTAGQLLVCGQFTSYEGNPVGGIARLNGFDGSFDSTFATGTGVNFIILNALVENDGKIVIVGQFGAYNGVARNCIARLNADGTLDTTFNLQNSTIQEINSIHKQEDKYIISGLFSMINGQPRNNIARLNLDGTLDPTFVIGSGTNQAIAKSLVLSNNKIILVGPFTFYNGVSRNRVVRLNPDGTLDTSFNPGIGANNNVFSVAVENDGKYLIGGNFTSYNGTPKKLLVRLENDGSIDNSFTAYDGLQIVPSTILIDQGNKILVGGFLGTIPNGDGKYLVRMNYDGTEDTNFNSVPGPNNVVNIIYEGQNSGNLYIGGWFTEYDGLVRNRLAQLNYVILNTEIFTSKAIKLFPNPVVDYLCFQSEIDSDLHLTIVDVQGKIVMESKLNLGSSKLDLQSLEKGVYIAIIKGNQGVHQEKIIKR